MEEIRSYYSRNHTYKGWTYLPSVHVDDKKDTYRVTHHYMNSETGFKSEADFTPYCYMSKIDFEMFVDLEFPKRATVGPLSSTILRRLKKERGV